MAGEQLDLSSGEGPNPGSDGAKTRRFLGVHFACCDVYTRIYTTRDGAAYAGACPRCGLRIRFPIGPSGTGARFFTVS